MHISEIKVLGKDPVQQEKGFGLQGELQVQLLQGRSGAADDLRVRAMLACLQEDSFPPSEDTQAVLTRFCYGETSESTRTTLIVKNILHLAS